MGKARRRPAEILPIYCSLLTYYLWERVVQDLIYLARNVCFRDDWTEETRAQVAQTFHESLEPGASNLRAAREASAHLPRNLA